jgi:hypothetical protein
MLRLSCSAYSKIWGLSAALIVGAATTAFGQEAPDLRLESDSDIEELAPISNAKISAITIGDDGDVKPVRKKRVVADPYAAQGVNAGAFRLFPSLEIGALAISSVSRTATGRESDVALRLRPELKFESDWVRHKLTGTAALQTQRYLDNKDLSTVDGNLGIALRLDVRRTTTADLDWSYSAITTGAGSNTLPTNAKGTRLDQSYGAGGAVTHDFGVFSGRLRMAATRNVYGDVETTGCCIEDNSDRNYVQGQVALRASVTNGAMFRPFAEVAYEPRFYQKSKDRNGIKRNSQGLRAATGVAFDDAIWSGEAAASLEFRNYEDKVLDDAIVPGLVANIAWRPTDLTRFEFNSGVSVGETLATDVGSTANWNATLTATHALRDNVDLVGSTGVAVQRVSGDTDVTSTATLGVNWTLNPYLVWSTRYEATWFNAASSGGDYTDHRILASIILRR